MEQVLNNSDENNGDRHPNCDPELATESTISTQNLSNYNNLIVVRPERVASVCYYNDFSEILDFTLFLFN